MGITAKFNLRVNLDFNVMLFLVEMSFYDAFHRLTGDLLDVTIWKLHEVFVKYHRHHYPIEACSVQAIGEAKLLQLKLQLLRMEMETSFFF